MSDRELLLAGLLAASLFVHLAVRVFARWRGSYLARRRSRRARRGEVRAAHLLRRAGFRICAEQKTRRWAIEVDGEKHEVTLRADYVVRSGSRRYVAEVKTGRSAPSIANVATRRQLLEYRIAYAVDGIVLVDPEAGSIREVSFPLAD